MCGKDRIYKEDGEFVAASESIDWQQLAGSSILITGATGLIGAAIIRGLMAYNAKNTDRIRLLALVRNAQKAEKMFGDEMTAGRIKMIMGDIREQISLEEPVDYIIHGAGETASKAFVEKPVETVMTAMEGTVNLLRLARQKQVKSMVYLSSMEVYGTTQSLPLSEENMGYLNPLAIRSSYPESKRMAENLCVSYFSEYGVPVKIVRLTQTFGPGISADDGRVFAEFARCAVEGRNICLQTKGETKRMYLYTADAADAILTVLTKGENGQAYNAANPETYCSIREMADMVSAEFGKGSCRVVFKIPDTPNMAYNPTQELYLDTRRLETLSWKPDKDLRTMYERMLQCM